MSAIKRCLAGLILAAIAVGFGLLSNPQTTFAAENLAVRVLKDGESLDDSQPTNKYRQVELLPAWFGDYINQVGSANANNLDEDDETTPATPDTGALTKLLDASPVTLTVITITAAFLLAPPPSSADSNITDMI